MSFFLSEIEERVSHDILRPKMVLLAENFTIFLPLKYRQQFGDSLNEELCKRGWKNDGMKQAKEIPTTEEKKTKVIGNSEGQSGATGNFTTRKQEKCDTVTGKKRSDTKAEGSHSSVKATEVVESTRSTEAIQRIIAKRKREEMKDDKQMSKYPKKTDAFRFSHSAFLPLPPPSSSTSSTTSSTSSTTSSSTSSSPPPPPTATSSSSSYHSAKVSNKLSSSSSLNCPVCLQMLNTPQLSPCGHVCCQSCWFKCLNEKLECPICRQRVRLKQLTKILF
jgi:hypothetical protein